MVADVTKTGQRWAEPDARACGALDGLLELFFLNKVLKQESRD